MVAAAQLHARVLATGGPDDVTSQIELEWMRFAEPQMPKLKVDGGVVCIDVPRRRRRAVGSLPTSQRLLPLARQT